MTTGKSLEHCSEFLIFIFSEHWSMKKIRDSTKFESKFKIWINEIWPNLIKFYYIKISIVKNEYSFVLLICYALYYASWGLSL
jgi:hypothetical protein